MNRHVVEGLADANNSGQHPGKCRIGDDHAHVPWGGGEVWVRPFQVLAYANPTRR